ncbi:MAG TPA: cobyric acid synthase [Candidatus Baltobacteraceae bacterium]|nr:cobyric acid synthase [Candidatus Baltobacteraceae bacterium]
MTRFAHGGNLYQLARTAGKAEQDLLDFSANINPLGPPEWLRAVLSAQVSRLVHYPDPDCSLLVEALADRYQVNADEVISGNGGTELLYLLPRVLERKRAVILVPAYVDYARAALRAGLEVEHILVPGWHDAGPVSAELLQDAVVFLGRPNNPTGEVWDADALRRLAAGHPGTVFVVDEAFGDFVDDLDSLTSRRPSNVVVLLSLTKMFAIPGLRLGAAIADTSTIRRLRDLQPAWSVNSLAQAVGTAAARDQEHPRRTRAYVGERREKLVADLQALPHLTVYSSRANFLLVRIDDPGLDAPALSRRLLNDGIAIRVCDNYEGLDRRFFRVAVRTEDENGRLLDALRRAVGSAAPAVIRRHTPALMFQGTSSNAGKSVLTAALCRILRQDGFRVAPFKAQNMSLNSFVTQDGREMGRAQVVQAQACRLEPDARMNPILLKPNSDTGSQVIVLGKPVGNMTVTEYIRYKPAAFRAVQQAYDELATAHDVVVLEGAGSPAEVNLKAHDIVNMQMARHAHAPVLLVGDIDRGGVFASFVGTMEVMAEWERRLVAGFIINQFRGQASLLDDAITYTQRHTGRPTFGVVPYLRDLGLPEEDSVTFKAAPADVPKIGAEIEIAVVDLPHISNFTDFDALRLEPDVQVRIVRATADLGQPDAVLLPGSKNVIGDLGYLRQSGLAAALLALAQAGRTEIVGQCGGYQMLGERIEDPHGIESGNGMLPGLAMLPLSTVMAPEKTLKRVSGRHTTAALAVTGYEIHHGRTVAADALQPMVVRADGEVIGVGRADGLVWGSYLHGIFDADGFRRWFVDGLRRRKGLAPIGHVVATYDLEAAFDRLADVVRENVRIEEIYRLMKLR